MAYGVNVVFFFFFKQKTAYEILAWLEFRRVLFRSHHLHHHLLHHHHHHHLIIIITTIITFIILIIITFIILIIITFIILIIIIIWQSSDAITINIVWSSWSPLPSSTSSPSSSADHHHSSSHLYEVHLFVIIIVFIIITNILLLCLKVITLCKTGTQILTSGWAFRVSFYVVARSYKPKIANFDNAVHGKENIGWLQEEKRHFFIVLAEKTLFSLLKYK